MPRFMPKPSTSQAGDAFDNMTESIGDDNSVSLLSGVGVVTENDSKTKRNKKKFNTHYTDEEKAIMCNELMPYKNILYSKFSSKITQSRKREIYKNVMEKLKMRGILIPQDSIAVFRDNVMDNIKRRARDKLHNSKQSGAAGVHYSNLDEKAIELFNLLGVHVTGLPDVENPIAGNVISKPNRTITATPSGDQGVITYNVPVLFENQIEDDEVEQAMAIASDIERIQTGLAEEIGVEGTAEFASPTRAAQIRIVRDPANVVPDDIASPTINRQRGMDIQGDAPPVPTQMLEDATGGIDDDLPMPTVSRRRRGVAVEDMRKLAAQSIQMRHDQWSAEREALASTAKVNLEHSNVKLEILKMQLAAGEKEQEFLEKKRALELQKMHYEVQALKKQIGLDVTTFENAN